MVVVWYNRVSILFRDPGRRVAQKGVGGRWGSGTPGTVVKSALLHVLDSGLAGDAQGVFLLCPHPP